MLTPSEIAASLMIVSMLGGGFVWLLTTKFATKKLLYTLKDKAYEERKMWAAEIERRIAEAIVLAQQCNQRHDLQKQPFEAVVNALNELKEGVKLLNSHAQERHDKLVMTLTGIDKRVTVIEEMRNRRRRLDAGDR